MVCQIVIGPQFQNFTFNAAFSFGAGPGRESENVDCMLP